MRQKIIIAIVALTLIGLSLFLYTNKVKYDNYNEYLNQYNDHRFPTENYLIRSQTITSMHQQLLTDIENSFTSQVINNDAYSPEQQQEIDQIIADQTLVISNCEQDLKLCISNTEDNKQTLINTQTTFTNQLAADESDSTVGVTDDPYSCDNTVIDGILLVNKEHCINASYAPGLEPEVSAAFEQMQADALNDGIELHILSDYRSYEEQVATFDYWVSVNGYEEATKLSAEPGFSEHQTGLVIDVGGTSCDLNECFATTPEGIWLADNCYKYGFIIRYPEGKEAITGYSYEPWHIRYVGITAATEITEQGITLEEYLDV